MAVSTSPRNPLPFPPCHAIFLPPSLTRKPCFAQVCLRLKSFISCLRVLPRGKIARTLTRASLSPYRRRQPTASLLSSFGVPPACNGSATGRACALMDATPKLNPQSLRPMSRHPFALRMSLAKTRLRIARQSASPFPTPYTLRAATIARACFLQSELAFITAQPRRALFPVMPL